jgi:hypothetical protein
MASIATLLVALATTSQGPSIAGGDAVILHSVVTSSAVSRVDVAEVEQFLEDRIHDAWGVEVSRTRPNNRLASAMAAMEGFKAKKPTCSDPSESESNFKAGVAMRKFPKPMGHKTRVRPDARLGGGVTVRKVEKEP